MEWPGGFMPKKPASRTKTAKIKTPAKKRRAMKTQAAPPSAKAVTGMWKILEMKKAQQKINEKHGGGRPGHLGPNGIVHAFNRNTRFTKFAGPRRKVG
jgi:hypothetical protein